MFPVEKIAHIVKGELLRGENATPARPIHDSRLVEPGDLFVALPGLRTDGHMFLSDAFHRGACAALVSCTEEVPSHARNIIRVPDPALALQQWASEWRKSLRATLIAITGTNGKTTVKGLLGHLLSVHANTYVSPHNYNTEIGLPIALLAMSSDADIGVLELGAENPGDIAMLARILRPHIAILTSVGPGHLEEFHTLDAVAREKWSLVEHLPADGTAIINADSAQLRNRAASARIDVISTGMSHGDLRGNLLQSVPSLKLRIGDHEETLCCPLVGGHNATNVLLSSVAAHRLGMSWNAIARQMESFRPAPHRLQVISAPFGTLLDDTYNANPSSTKAALEVLCSWSAGQSARLFVFGDMLELGEDSQRFHREIARHALQLPIDFIIPVGPSASAACQAVADGDDSERLVILPRHEINHWVSQYGRALVVLVKGSRGLALETLVNELLSPNKG